MPKKYWWFPFDPNDWAADLQEHPLKIEGAWIRIICRIWEQGEGTRTIYQWARLFRTSIEKTWGIMAYLAHEDIADVTLSNDDVSVVCRRLYRDANKREQNRLQQQRSRSRRRCQRDVSGKKDKKKEKKKTDMPSFDAFWSEWPRKVARAAAIKAWAKIQPDEVPALMAALDKHKRQADWLKENGKYIPYPASWLNGRRWEDVVGQQEGVTL